MAKDKLTQALADLRASAAREDDEALRKAVLVALDTCASGADLKRVLNSAPCEQAIYGEAELPHEAGLLLAEKARSWKKDSDVAQAIMWLVRMSCFHPACVVRPDRDAELGWQLKETLAAVVDSQRDFYRQKLSHKSAPLRHAAGHALARCRNVTCEDRTLLLEVVGERAARATFVLALGVVSYRTKATDASMDRFIDDGDALVQCSAVAAMALRDPNLPDEAIVVLARHIQKPARLPPQWGWFYLNRTCDSSDMALALCHWIRHPKPRPLIEGVSGDHAAALVHLAFDARGLSLPESGVALEDLDDLQRVAVKAVSKNHDWTRPLGVWGQTDEFFEAKEPAWVPLSVDGHRWHFKKIWNATLHGEIDAETAIDAVTNHFGPREWLRLVLRTEGSTAGTELALRFVRRFEGDLPKAIEEALQDLDYPVWPIATAAILSWYDERKEPPPAPLERLLAKGIEGELREPLRSLLSKLSLEQRERLVLASNPERGGHWFAMSFAEICPTEPVVRAIVERVRRAPSQRDEAVEVLRKTQPPMPSFDDPELQRIADQLLR